MLVIISKKYYIFNFGYQIMIKLKAPITQASFFQRYSSAIDFDEYDFKERVLQLAQKLKLKIAVTASFPRLVERKLNDIALRIQRRINQGNLFEENLNRYIDELQVLFSFEEGHLKIETLKNSITLYLKCCLLLSKHQRVSTNQKVTNYFGITNKTESILLLVISSMPDKKLTNEAETIDELNRELISIITIHSEHSLMKKPDEPIIDKNQVENAVIIQKYFRGYIVRQNNFYLSDSKKVLVDVFSKKKLEEHMKVVIKGVHHVPTAQYVNRDKKYFLAIERFLKENKIRRASMLKYHIGNCLEISVLLCLFIRTDDTLPAPLRSQTRVLTLQEPDDHAFVCIGDPKNPHSIILDGWLKYVDLFPTKGFRDKTIFACERELGFIGTKSAFLEFLKHHEDGVFVRKSGFHDLVFRAIPDQLYASILENWEHQSDYPSLK